MPVTTSASGVVTAGFGGVSQSLNFTVRPIGPDRRLVECAGAWRYTVSGVSGPRVPRGSWCDRGQLLDNRPAAAAATVPSITIPTGGASGAFSVRTSPVASEMTVTIYATVFGVRKGVTLTVTP